MNLGDYIEVYGDIENTLKTEGRTAIQNKKWKRKKANASP